MSSWRANLHFFVKDFWGSVISEKNLTDTHLDREKTEGTTSYIHTLSLEYIPVLSQEEEAQAGCVPCMSASPACQINAQGRNLAKWAVTVHQAWNTTFSIGAGTPTAGWWHQHDLVVSAPFGEVKKVKYAKHGTCGFSPV